MATIETLVETWRDMSPADWAEHKYGWILPTGQAIELVDWQRAVLEAWWQHREAVTTLAISNIKKTGKTTLNAIITAWRWLSLPGEHFCVANDLDQSQGRQFQMIAEMAKRHNVLKEHTKVTKNELTLLPTASTLKALAVDAAGNAGSNHATASHTETWGIIYESGIRAFEELTPPPDKTSGFPALRICDSYAGYIGESDTWHRVVDRGLAGQRTGGSWPLYLNGGLLLFHMDGEEAQEKCFRGTRAEAQAYYTEQRETLRTGAYSRLHLNLRATGESRFVPLEAWDDLIDPSCRPLVPGDTRPIWLGADAATKRDAVALVGCTWNQDKGRGELAYVRKWEPKTLAKLAGGIDLDETIGAEIERLHREHNLREVRFDPYQFAAIANRLQKAGVNVVEMPQTAQRAEADQALYDAITSGTLATFPSPALRESISKAASKETVRGYRLEKRSGDDLAAALSMAHFSALRGGNVPAPTGMIVDTDLTGFLPSNLPYHLMKRVRQRRIHRELQRLRVGR